MRSKTAEVGPVNATPPDAAVSTGNRLGQAIVRGASWTTAGQLTALAVNIVMTPYVIHGFGLARYGLYLLANTIVSFLASFDGGIGGSVTRYSAVYAGADNRAATTRLITSLSLIVSLVGIILFSILFFLAGPILSLFHPPRALQAEGAYLLRSIAFVLGFLQLRSLFTAQLSARQLYGWQSFTTIISYGVYAIGVIITVHFGYGLRGLAWTFVAQAVVATLLIVPKTLPFLDRQAIGFMPRDELRSFLRYAGTVQAGGLTGIISTQADTFIVGRLLSVSAIAIYGTGANFALQMRNVPANFLVPISTSVSQAYGRGGDAEAVQVFTRLQRRWVQGSTGWCSVALGAAYFGVTSWLGPQFETSGMVACLLTASATVNLWTGTLTALLSAVGRPSIEVRYVTLAVVINVALTIPLVLWLGVLGTVLATAVGGIVGSLYLVEIARRRYDPHLRSFLADVPVMPALFTVGIVTTLEVICRPLVPRGAVGLLVAGLVASPGLAAYTMLLVGPKRAVALAQVRLRSRISA